MSTKRVSYELTPENLSSRMVVGQRYTPYELAAKLRIATEDVRPMIEEMIERRQVVAQPTARFTYYARPAEDVIEAAMQVDQPVETFNLTVAGRSEPPDLKNTMRGYESTIFKRMSLCMLARGAR